MPTYNPSAHPALSPAAARLGAEALDAQADTAEALLGLSGGSYDTVQATLAVVHQVNHQVELGPEGFARASSGRGGRSVTYRDGDPSISPLAARIAAQLKGWRTAGGLR